MPKQYSMSDPKAQRVLLGLRAGLTLRLVGERPRRFSEYCSRHPDYAREAQPLEAANAKAAYLRKGAYLREKTHCDNGHLLAEHARFAVYKGWKTRKCKICHHMRYRRGGGGNLRESDCTNNGGGVPEQLYQNRWPRIPVGILHSCEVSPRESGV
jgi:hypothetical protein